jgi:hypothetical protein
MESTRWRVAAVTEEGSVQIIAGDHAVCFESRDGLNQLTFWLK